MVDKDKWIEQFQKEMLKLINLSLHEQYSWFTNDYLTQIYNDFSSDYNPEEVAYMELDAAIN